MAKHTIRVIINEETFRKYKVYCAIENVCMTDMTNKVIKDFVDSTDKKVKIIKVDNA